MVDDMVFFLPLALIRVGHPDQMSVDALVACLDGAGVNKIVSVAMVLASYGETASSALPALERFRSHADFDVRVHAAIAMDAIQPADTAHEPGPPTGTVNGECLHITHGLPGALAGRPGSPVPPRAAPGATVFFLSSNHFARVQANPDGRFTLELVPGLYEVAWQIPWPERYGVQGVWDRYVALNYTRPQRGSPPIMLTVREGEEKDFRLAVTEKYVD